MQRPVDGAPGGTSNPPSLVMAARCGAASITHVEVFFGGGPMMDRIRAAARRDDGASAVEYALLVAGIAAIVIVAVTFLGRSVSAKFSQIGSTISSTG